MGPQRDEGRFEVESSMHAGAHRRPVGGRHRFDHPVEHEAGGQDLVEQHSHRDPPERHPPPAAEPVEQGVDALDREVAAARLQPVGRGVTRRQHEPPAGRSTRCTSDSRPTRLSMWWYTSGITTPSNDASSSMPSGRSRSCATQLDVGADTGTGPRELLSAPLDADHLGAPGDELGEVVARPASDVGEPQPIDLPAEIEHRRSVVVRVVEAILGLRSHHSDISS